jgi:hypothetical protein
MSEPGGLRATARAEVEASLIDLSLGGALLQLRAPLEVGSIHDFRLDLFGQPLWVQAEVRRCQAASGAYEVAVQFVGVHPQDEARLRDYLERAR